MEQDIDFLKKREELDLFLLALHRTMEADAFWGALQNLLDAAFPNQSIVAALRVSDEYPPVFYHTHHRPHHTHQWFTETLMAHPCHAYLMANPGTPVLRLGEVFPVGILENHPFFKDSMEPEGWFHGLAFIFWKGGQIDSLIPVNRSRSQPDFSVEEIRLAHWLHSRIEAALHRINHLLPIADAHNSLVSYLSDLQLPTLRLCWNLRLAFANRAARTLLDEWRSFGSDIAPRGSISSRGHIPRDIRNACASVKQKILSAEHPHWPPPVLPPPVRIAHPATDEFSAVIRPTLTSRRLLSNPSFWIHLEKTVPPQPSPNLTVIHLLSPAERAVADLLLLGLTNAQIAARLHRSLSTVKAQLQSAYRKLGVHNRAAMIARIHGKA